DRAGHSEDVDARLLIDGSRAAALPVAGGLRGGRGRLLCSERCAGGGEKDEREDGGEAIGHGAIVEKTHDQWCTAQKLPTRIRTLACPRDGARVHLRQFPRESHALRLCDMSESSLQTRAASMNRNTGARA